MIRRLTLGAAAPLFALLAFAAVARAHCQLPCGIYDDHARYDSMKEDAQTIRKTMSLIAELSGKTDAQSAQQLVRSVETKDAHAQATQQTVLDYFLAQRVKTPAGKDAKEWDAYKNQLVLLHQIVVDAMKCKQNADPKWVDELDAKIDEFWSAYHPQ